MVLKNEDTDRASFGLDIHHRPIDVVLLSVSFLTFSESDIYFARVSPRANIGCGSVDACTCYCFL